VSAKTTWVTWTRATVAHAGIEGVGPGDTRNGGFPLECGRWAPEGFDTELSNAPYGRRCRKCEAVIAKRKRDKEKARKARLGRCYELCAHEVVAARLGQRKERENLTLVHGSVKSNGHPRIGHAWVEWDEGPFMVPHPDGTPREIWHRNAYDPVYDIETLAGVYRNMAQAEYHHSYSVEEAATWMVKTQHYGPWQEPHDALPYEEGEWEGDGPDPRRAA
jgi:hypothetical protein